MYQLRNLMPNPVPASSGYKPVLISKCTTAYEWPGVILTPVAGADNDRFIDYALTLQPGVTYVARAQLERFTGTKPRNGLMGMHGSTADGKTVTAWDQGAAVPRECSVEFTAQAKDNRLRLYAPDGDGTSKWVNLLVMSKTEFQRMQTEGLRWFYGDTMPLNGGGTL